jgi:hypothetical protein
MEKCVELTVRLKPITPIRIAAQRIWLNIRGLRSWLSSFAFLKQQKYTPCITSEGSKFRITFQFLCKQFEICGGDFFVLSLPIRLVTRSLHYAVLTSAKTYLEKTTLIMALVLIPFKPHPRIVTSVLINIETGT